MKTIELPASKKGESCQTDVGWCDQNDALAEFVDRLGPDTLSLADLIGAQTLKKIEKLSIPLIATFEEETRQTTYRRAEGMSDFVAHKIPNAVWIEIDPRTSLKRALALYSDRLLAYEKMNRREHWKSSSCRCGSAKKLRSGYWCADRRLILELGRPQCVNEVSLPSWCRSLRLEVDT